MLSTQEVKELKRFAADIRIQCMEQFKAIGVGHVGGSMSICDLMACLYGKIMRIDPADPRMEARDRIVVSKGHSGPAMYAALALKGFFPVEELKTINRLGTRLPSHTDRNRTPGVDMTTGSLGQGFSSGLGIAYGCKLKGIDNYTYIILGDGELGEGQVWECALFAAAKGLDRVVVFVDANGYQLDGTTDEVLALGDIRKKFEDFGWEAVDVEHGNDVEAICRAVEQVKKNTSAPKLIVLHTVKGLGCPAAFSPDLPTNHNMNVSPQVADETIAALQREKEALK
jgi:transketolase